MKALQAFIKLFEAPQRSVKIKLIFILIQLSEKHFQDPFLNTKKNIIVQESLMNS